MKTMLNHKFLALFLAGMFMLTGRAYSQEQDPVQGQVQLKDLSYVSWFDFVSAIRNPQPPKGVVDESLQTAYNEALAAKTSAKERMDQAFAVSQLADSLYHAADLWEDTCMVRYNRAVATRDSISAIITSMPSKEKETVTTSQATAQWLQDISDKANAFDVAFSVYAQGGVPDITKSIWFYETSSTFFGKTSRILYVSFADMTGKGNWQNYTLEQFVSNIFMPEIIDETYLKQVESIYLYLCEIEDLPQGTSSSYSTGYIKVGPPYNAPSLITNLANYYSTACNAPEFLVTTTTSTPTARFLELSEQLTAAQTVVDAKYQEWENAKADMTTKKDESGLTTIAYNQAKKESEDADAAFATAEANLTNAQAEADAAAENTYFDKYKKAVLQTDIDLSDCTTDKTTYMLFEFGGFLDGQNHIIILPANGPNTLINSLIGDGRIVNLAVRNGDIASSVNSEIAIQGSAYQKQDVGTLPGEACWYDNQGKATTYNSPSAANFGYAIRDKFGFNIETGHLADLTYRVFKGNIYGYSTANKEENKLPIHTNIIDGQLAPESVYAKLTTNRFAEVINTVREVTQPNVVVTTIEEEEEEEAYRTCANVVISDTVDFYCPFKINEVAHLSYDREFKAGWGAACLPFAVVPKSYKDDQGNTVTPENGIKGVDNLFTFGKEDAKAFWFLSSTGVAGNRPIILYSKDGGKIFENVENTMLLASRKDGQFMEDENNGEETGYLYGTYRSVTAQSVSKDHTAASVYGFAGGSFVKAGDTAAFKQFRSFFVSKPEIPNTETRAMRVLDFDGTEMSDNLTTEVVALEAEDLFCVNGVEGGLNIISSKDMGTINVYTINGQVAASADVVAGENTVSLAKGVYIVKGKKVLVY